jgi:hypothetical protein
MKPILVFPPPKAVQTPKWFFESPPTADFQKTDFYNMNCCYGSIFIAKK